MSNCIKAICLGLIVTLTACNSGGGDEQTDSTSGSAALPQPQPSTSPFSYRVCSDYAGAAASPGGLAALPGGFWHGVITNETRKETEPFELAVTEDGRFWFFIDYDELIGTLTTDGNTFAGGGIANSGGSRWADGTLQSELAMAGTITERDSLTGTWSLASGDAGCYEAFYDEELYERSVTLEQIEGDWSTLDGWGLFKLTLTIDANGDFAFYDPWDCSHSGSGQLSVMDERYNLFEIREMTADCPVAATPYTGLVYAASLSAAGTDRVVTSIVIALADENGSFRIAFSR